MKLMIQYFVLWLIALLSASLVRAEITYTTNLTYLVREIGGRVDWCDKKNLLVVDLGGTKDLYTQIWTMDLNGKNQTCLTTNRSVFLEKHNGNPAWHPSGDYIVFQAQNPKIGKLFAGSWLHKVITSPGAGVQNDIWIMRADASLAWKVTEVTGDGGVLHPHFSPDGSKLIWAEMTKPTPGPTGTWVMKMGDFTPEKNSIISNITTLTPGDFLWYETHSFSPDNASFLFTGMRAGGDARDFDIYRYDLQTKKVTQLTDPSLKHWDEHAHFTPDGKQIIWMSSMDQGQKPSEINQFKVKIDYWIMNADGSNKKRLTFFNTPDKEERILAADFTITADGKYLIGYIQDPGVARKPGSIVRLELR
jgi:Tol biopolymer transport system component